MENFVKEEIEQREIFVEETKKTDLENVVIKKKVDRDLEKEYTQQLLAESLANKFVSFCNKISANYDKVSFSQKILTNVAKEKELNFQICYNKQFQAYKLREELMNNFIDQKDEI